MFCTGKVNQSECRTLNLLVTNNSFYPECAESENQDIVVVLDSSTSIARRDFKEQLEFVNSLIQKIAVGPNDNQVGVVSFSDNYRLNFHLNANRYPIMQYYFLFRE